ncbi:MAG: hypothetical protein NWS46_02590 [Cyclobacteriaceae bacterium]|jgi:hypothetical protein|nr:hypothetical protein [Cyclobacteriaceae bacterium]
MAFILRLVLIAISCYGLGFVMPWWSIVVCCIAISFFLPGYSFNAFLSGFLGVGLLWMVMAWKYDMLSGSNMSSKILQLFPIDDHIILIVVTGLLGGLVGGFSAITGNTFRQLFIKKKKGSFYN